MHVYERCRQTKSCGGRRTYRCTLITVRNVMWWVCRNTAGSCCGSYMSYNVKWLIHDSLTAIVTKSNILPLPSCVFDPRVHSRSLHGCWVELILRCIFMSGLWLFSPQPEGENCFFYIQFSVWGGKMAATVSLASQKPISESSLPSSVSPLLFPFFFGFRKRRGGVLRERQKERKNQSAPSILDF